MAIANSYHTVLINQLVIQPYAGFNDIKPGNNPGCTHKERIMDDMACAANGCN